ncbi:hypothetical protein AB4396_20050 [Vibrio cyclitrophicus]
MKEQNIYFDPDTSFFELKIVRLTALSFILVFTLVCAVIIDQSNLWGEWNFTHFGFNNLLDYFKVPLGFLALMIPVGAVFAANHRSEQTKRQIALTHKQNLFTNYYKHIEEFEKFTEKSLSRVFVKNYLGKAEEHKINFDSRHMHKVLFNDLIHTGNTQANAKLLNKIDVICMGMFNPLPHKSESSVEQIRTSLMTTILQINKVLQKQNISFGGIFQESLEAKANKIVEYESNQADLQKDADPKSIDDGVSCYYIADFLYRIEFILSTFEACARFDTSYSGSVSLRALEASKRAVLMTEDGEPVKSAHEKLLHLCSYSEDIKSTIHSPFDISTYYPRAMAIKYTLERAELFKKYLMSQQ